MPRAMVNCGILLGSAVLLLAGVLAVFATNCILEAMARAGPVLEHAKHARGKYRYGALETEDGADGGAEASAAATVTGTSCPPAAANVTGRPDDPRTGGGGPSPGSGNGAPEGTLWVVGEERIDVPRLCGLFLGDSGRQAYTLTICVYVYCSLWVYAVLVAQTFSVALPLVRPTEIFTAHLTRRWVSLTAGAPN